MMIGCMQLTDVTRYEVRYDSDRFTDVANIFFFGGGGCLYGAYIPGENFELILTVKMEARHPVGGQFGREFPAICNRCGVI